MNCIPRWDTLPYIITILIRRKPWLVAYSLYSKRGSARLFTALQHTTFPCAMCISMTRPNVFINYCNYFFILSSLIHYMFPLLNLLANSFWLFFFMCSLSVCNCTFVQLFHSFAVFHINNGLQSIGQSNHKSDIEKKVIFILSSTPIIKMMQYNTTFPCANVFINYCSYFFK